MLKRGDILMSTQQTAEKLLHMARTKTYEKNGEKQHVEDMCSCVQELMQDRSLAGASERSRLKRELLQACEDVQADTAREPVDAAPASEGQEPGALQGQWRPSRCTGVKRLHVHGMDQVQRTLRESLQLPLQFPDLFKRLGIRPCRAMLLYGPPGTGKSLVARALAGEQEVCLFEASCAQITSRWVGESEKLLKSLFEALHAHAPAVLFLDEVDSIATSRESDKASSVADQRLLNQLLLEMDGLHLGEGSVFMLAATNLPWQLDPAVLRRFSKRVHVGLPDAGARCRMLRDGIGHHTTLSDAEFEHLARDADGLSGSDIANASRDALMGVLQRLLTGIEFDVHVRARPTPAHEVLQDEDEADAGPAEDDTLCTAPSPVECVHITDTTFDAVYREHRLDAIVIPELTYFQMQVCIEGYQRTVTEELAERYKKYAAAQG